MPRSPIREIDLRLATPLAAVLIFVAALAAWVAIDYPDRVNDTRAQAAAQWQRNLTRIAPLLRQVPADQLLASFSDAPGLRYLAVVTVDGRILHANRKGLINQRLGALNGFDAKALDPAFLDKGKSTIAVTADGHLRGYYPMSASYQAPGDRIRPPTNAVLYLDLDTAALTTPIRSRLMRHTWIFAAFLVATLLAGALFIHRYAHRPTHTIVNAVSRYRPGQSLPPIPLVGEGPLSRLAREFERAAQTLNETLAEISLRGERLDRTLESIGDGVIITDADGRVERLNQVAEALTGWSRDAARGHRIDEVFAPFDNTNLQPLPNPVLQVLETETVVELANHAAIESRTGQLWQIADTAAPIRNADGTVEGVVLVFHDVTEAYRLREQQRIAAVAFETGAPQLIADRDGQIIRVNQAALTLGGYAPEEILGANLVGAVFVGQESHGLREFLSGASSEDSWSGPTWWRHKNGETIHIWVHDTILRDERGGIAYYVISAIDTTELVKASSALGETRENYRQLIGAIHDGVAIIQGETFVDCNEALAEMLRRPRTGILGRTVTDLSLPRQADGSDSTTLALAMFEQVMDKRNAYIDWSLVRADGRQVLLEATLSRILWQGEPALLAVARDITERQEHETERQRLLAALERSEQMMRLACSAYGIASWELDVATGELTWAQGAEAVLGVSRKDLPTSEAAAMRMLTQEQQDLHGLAISEAVRGSRPFGFEFAANIPGMGQRWLRSQGEHRLGPDGKRFLHGAITDVTEQRQAQQDIEQLAFHDSLTGLANRRLFLDRLAQASRQAQRSGLSGAVLFVDLDRFKLLNDSLGHAAGDALLREVARRCEDAVREADTVARLGGDEFVILVTDLGSDESQVTHNAERIANKLHTRLDTEYPLGDHAYHLSASIGIALFPRDGENAEELLRHADVAMYQVKQRGRNAVAFYQPGLQDRADQRLIIERELRLALDRGELLLHYQPKVDASGSVIGAETLLRWHHPTRGMVPPLDFIPIAEDTGLIHPIGKLVLEQACAQLARWRECVPARQLSLAVNISPHQFRHPDFVSQITAAVQGFGIEPGQLIIEITEGTMLESIDLVISRMQDLKALGIGLAIDDFGTGYSSLYYLKNLPLDEIKIDQSYVRDLLDDANDAAIVESIIAIAHNLKLRTVAEGVETQAQGDKLREMGCLVHQGYFYSRPLPLADFEAFTGS
ncbi:MAG TPA: EAL domain-containing protein [Porticoccaceae bacterium]|nr:EAL domain-containing protein [Porticoccaceae bacterium]